MARRSTQNTLNAQNVVFSAVSVVSAFNVVIGIAV